VPGGRHALVLRWVWDSERDARGFGQAAERSARALGDAAVRRRGREVSLALAPQPGLAEALATRALAG